MASNWTTPKVSLLSMLGSTRALADARCPAISPRLAPLMIFTLPDRFNSLILACSSPRWGPSPMMVSLASGTSPKQVSKETDCCFVGYGSMVLESFLAVLVLICVAAGIAMAYKTADGSVLSGSDAWNHHYASWAGAKGLGSKLAAFVIGAANIVGTLKLPPLIGTAIMGVFVASFAGTTLDTSVRIQRYIVSELATDLKIPLLPNRWVATTFAVVTAAALAFATGADGAGAMKLWPLFGSANQLLAALALLVITLYLKRKGGLKYLVTALPCVVMLVITNWAMVCNEMKYIREENWLLVTIGGVIFVLALWVTVEAVITFFKSAATASGD